MENTHITPEQVQHLIDRFDLNVAEFAGGQTMCLARNNGRDLKIDTVRKMLGLKETKGWTKVGKWVRIYI